MEPVRYSVCEEHKKVIDERFARDKERLDHMETKLDDVQTLSIQMGEILKKYDDKIEGQSRELESHEARIKTLEIKPAKLWDKLVYAALGALASGLVALIINLSIK